MSTGWKCLLVTVAIVVGAATSAPVAVAQHAALAAAAGGGDGEAAALPETLTRSEVREIVSRLSDEEVRNLLITQLDKVAAADGGEEEGGAEELLAAGDRARDHFIEIIAAAPRIPAALGQAWDTFTAGGETGAGRLLLALVLAIVATVVVERIFVRMAGSIAKGGSPDSATGLSARFGLLAMRAVCDLLAIAIGFAAAVGVLFMLIADNEYAPLVLARTLGTFAAIRAVAAISRAVLAPNTPWLRLLPINDRVAAGVHARVVVFVALWTLSALPVQLLALLDAEPLAVAGSNLAFSALLILGLVIMAVQVREPVADYIRGGPRAEGQADGIAEVLASRWHVLVATYLIGLWVLALGVKLGTGEEVSGRAIASLLLLVALPVLDSAVRVLCAKLLGSRPTDPIPVPSAPVVGAHGEIHDGPPPAIEESAAEPAPPGSQIFEKAMVRNVRILLALVAVLAFASIWELDLLRLAEGLVGGRLAASLFEIVLTLILAYALWSLVKAGVAHLLGEDPEAGGGDDDGEQEIGGPGLSRVATLLPLLRTVVAVTLGVMVVMIVLSALGVNIGPLLAGAGMLGLAIGFGAQTLVKDVISGFFFLLDDAFRMGEYVEIDAIRGSVERISVRSLQLRHHNGPVHTLPFGDIGHITNYSRDWAIMKFELRLPYDADINKVRKIIKGVGQEMMEDEALSQGMLQPLKSQGVNRMDDSALIVRCKFTSKPGEQFVLRREAYTRIQQALAAAGIQFAPRRVIVETSDGSHPTPQQLQAAGGSVDTPAPAAGGGPG